MQAIIIVIIRLWAINLIINAVTTLTYNLQWVQLAQSEFDNTSTIWMFGFYITLLAIMGITAFYFAPKVASLHILKTKEDTVNISIESETFIAIGSFLIGGFYLVESLPNVFSLGFYFYTNYIHNSDNNNLIIYNSSFFDLVKNIIIVSVSLFLVTQPLKIAKIFSHFRYIGLYKEKESSIDD